MVLSVALKDFYNNLVSSRFVIGFILCLFLIPFTMIASIDDFKKQTEMYEIDTNNAEKKYEVRVWSGLRPDIVKPPEPLSIVCRGISNNVGNIVPIYFGDIPVLAAGKKAEQDNPFLNSFFTIDFVSVLTMLMSLLALLFSYDAFTGEREAGTLKLVFSNSASRFKMLLGKISGILMTLMSVMTFSFLLSAVIIMLHRSVSFTGDDWITVVLIFCMSLLYVALFIVLGLFVSSRCRRSETSVIMCLFMWVVFVFVVPNTSVYVARNMVKVDSINNLNYELKEVESEFWEKFRAKWGELFPMLTTGVHASSHIWDDHGFRQIGGTSGDVFKFFRLLNTYAEPLRIENAEKKWEHQRVYLEKLDRVRKTAEALSLFSPSEVFRLAASELCRTDVASHYRFLDSARRYREELIGYYTDNNLFAEYTYFTRHSPELFKTVDERIKLKSGGKFATYGELKEWEQEHPTELSPLTVQIPEEDPNSYPFLDVSKVPRYRYETLAITDNLRKTLRKLGGISLAFILLLYATFVSFTRYDVR